MSKPTIIYAAAADGPVVNLATNRPVSQYSAEHLVLEKMVQSARALAMATGSVGASEVREAFGVTIELRWSREAAKSAAGKHRAATELLFGQAV